MAEKKIQARIRQKVDTKANWDKATNFVPLKGEVIIYSDLNQAKIGDGVTKVSALPFLKGKADATDKNPTLAWGSKSTVATVDGIDLHVTMPSNPNTHQTVTDKNPTLAWGAKSAVATIGSTNIHVTMPANPDTHFTTGLYVGKASEKSNSATTNGNTYLKLFDNDTRRMQHLINGTGLTTVTSDANGTITINSTLPTNLVTTNTEQTVTGTKHFNAITANTIGTGSDANNYFQSQKFRGEGDANTYYHAVDFGYANHDQVDFYEYGGVWNFYRNQQADTSAKELLFGINPSGIKLPTVTGAKVLGTNADGQVESHSLGIADISSLQSTLDGKAPYTGATKDVDLGKHSLSISNKSDGTGKITISSQGISEDDVYCEITSAGVQLMDPGAGTGYKVNYIDVNGFKVYLPNATYMPSGAEVFAMKSNLSNLLDKGSASTNDNQVVYNPVEMKKALTVPSVQGTKYTDNSGNQQSLFTLGGTVSGSGNTSQGSSSLTLYRNRAGSWDSASITFTPADGLKINNYAVGVQNWSNIPGSYILTNGDGVTKDVNGCVKLKSSGGVSSDDFVFESTNNGKLHSKMSVGPSGLVRGGWCIDNSKIITEATIRSVVDAISSESILSICI